jgi:hypothetical protein
MILKFINLRKISKQKKIIKDLKLRCISKYKLNTLLYGVICEMKINKHKGLKKLDKIASYIFGGYHPRCLECRKILECKTPKDIFHSFGYTFSCKEYEFNKSYFNEDYDPYESIKEDK